MKFKRILFLVLIFAFVLSTFAFADFSSTDSSHLSTIYSKTTSIASYLSTYLPDINTIKTNTNSIKTDASLILSSLNSFFSPNSSGSSNMYSLTKDIADELDGLGTVLAHIDARTISENRGLSTWINLMAGRMITSGYSVADSGYESMLSLKDIFALLNADKQKQDDALSDYSSSGGKSASDVSSDMGNISGSVSSNLDSGVSMDKALTAVDDNESYFHYFFFDMKDDLDTSGGGASRSRLRSAPSSDSGSDVPDFLSDYWGGLNG